LGTQYLVAALKRSEDFNTNNPKEFGLSASITQAKEGNLTTLPPFLDLIETPSVDLDAWKVKEIPSHQSSIRELATYAVLSKIDKNTQQKNIMWEAYAPNWINQMSLPLWPEQLESAPISEQNIFNTWEVSFLGTNEITKDKGFNLGPSVIGATSHLSYNKKEFQ
jgi:hypothetical protein